MSSFTAEQRFIEHSGQELPVVRQMSEKFGSSAAAKNFHAERQNCLTTFRGYQSVAKPTNCVLSAKIKFLREKNGTTQEKPAIADNRCYALYLFDFS